MANALQHPHEKVVAALLVDLALGADPDAQPLGSWPVYTTDEPGEPDNVVTVFDTEGTGDGRAMPTGEAMHHPGIQVRVRAADPLTGYRKADEIRTAMAQSVNLYGITVGSTDYLVNCFARISQVRSLGKESPSSRRRIFVINAVVSLRTL